LKTPFFRRDGKIMFGKFACPFSFLQMVEIVLHLMEMDLKEKKKYKEIKR
jgi:hypothetical protein